MAIVAWDSLKALPKSAAERVSFLGTKGPVLDLILGLWHQGTGREIKMQSCGTGAEIHINFKVQLHSLHKLSPTTLRIRAFKASK